MVVILHELIDSFMKWVSFELDQNLHLIVLDLYSTTAYLQSQISIHQTLMTMITTVGDLGHIWVSVIGYRSNGCDQVSLYSLSWSHSCELFPTGV